MAKSKISNLTPKVAKSVPAPSSSATHELSITVSGTEHVVRRAVTALSFSSEWNRIVTRQIALDQTLNSDATLQDTLGGSNLQLSTDLRPLYIGRCVNEAGRRGHAIPDPSSLPSDEGTTVMEVGDALFDNSVH